MTGRTHDLAALTALTFTLAIRPVPPMTLSTAIVAFGANMIGGLLPDIDDATSDFWDTIRVGNIVGKIIRPLIGHHRMISHSIMGMAIAGFLIKFLLVAAHPVLLVDMDIVWWSAMIGYFSHLAMDSFTKEGVPWLFPIPVRIGFPPLKILRVKTGGAIEKVIVFPGLLVLNGYLIYSSYPVFLSFFRNLIR